MLDWEALKLRCAIKVYTTYTLTLLPWSQNRSGT